MHNLERREELARKRLEIEWEEHGLMPHPYWCTKKRDHRHLFFMALDDYLTIICFIFALLSGMLTAWHSFVIKYVFEIVHHLIFPGTMKRTAIAWAKRL